MTTNIANQSSYLPTTRTFPTKEVELLAVEINKAYVDIANTVNDRTISLFPANRGVVNGENWYLTTRKQQGFRQIYAFKATGNIAHGLKWTSVAQFTKCTGSFTDGTNWYGAFYASNTAIAGQITFYITPTNIVVLAGAGAPTISTGTIVLEWISNV